MISRPLAACVVVIALAGLTGRAHAQRAEADAEFQRGRTLMARGDTAEACAAFEASMKLDPERGTLYNLGLCHEKLGKLASAWAELSELSRTDTSDARAKDAARRAAALLPRLTKMHLIVHDPADGLVVTRDQVDVTPLIDKEAPVDPGRYTFEARAPGKKPFTLEVDLTAEGKTVEVLVPKLHVESDGDATEPQPSGYPIELPRRPILIPQGIAEVSVWPSVSQSVDFDRTAVDTGASARVRLGPFEVAALLGFHLRSAFVMNKPNPWDSVGFAVRYPISPALVVGLSYVEFQPLRTNNRGPDLAANVERKLLVYPKVAVDGRAGLIYSQRGNDGDAFVVVGEGRVQFSVIGALSVEGFAGLDLNLAGSLYNYTVGLEVAALGLYAITPRFDAFAQVANDLLPDANLHTYTVGVSWRTH